MRRKGADLPPKLEVNLSLESRFQNLLSEIYYRVYFNCGKEKGAENSAWWEGNGKIFILFLTTMHHFQINNKTNSGENMGQFEKVIPEKH